MPIISTNDPQLPEDVGMYVDTLRQQHPAIDEVWLLGASFAAGNSGERWQLLAFADHRVPDALRNDADAQRSDVSILVVTDGDRFECAVGSAGSGRLSDVDWRVEDPQSATYTAPTGKQSTKSSERSSALRVR